MIKNKRFISVASAVVFLVLIILLKTGNVIFKGENTSEGLAYDGVLLSDLVNKDTDGDGLLDWEENLYGTDLNKKDTNDDGVPDGAQINKIEKNNETIEENLTETEKFSRELFSTIATLSQSGEISQDTAEQLSSSLAEKIKTSEVRKIYKISDIKINTDNGMQSIERYRDELLVLYSKYKIKETVPEIFKQFLADGENLNIQALTKLDAIIKQAGILINGMLKLSVPSTLSVAHLELINSIERLVENLTDIKLFDIDPLVAMGGISNYEKNNNSFELATTGLGDLIKKKLGN